MKVNIKKLAATLESSTSCKLEYRSFHTPTKIHAPIDIKTYFLNYMEPQWENISHTESFYVLFLNRSNNVICHTLMSMGGITSTIVDIKIVMLYAVLLQASAIITIHNHPSGNNMASNEDKSLHEKIRTACNTLQINLLDWMIVSPNNTENCSFHYTFYFNTEE